MRFVSVAALVGTELYASFVSIDIIADDLTRCTLNFVGVVKNS